MPRHEFGIMQKSPISGERYDNYDPEKYCCISVDDDDIEPLLTKLQAVKCYWHTLDRPEFGLAYYGVTLIPPQSMEAMMKIMWQNRNLSELLSLLSEAQSANKFIIHFGL